MVTRLLQALLAAIVIGAAAASALVVLTAGAAVELGTLWHTAAPESLNLAQAVTQRYLHPAVWTHVLLPVLLTPASVVFAGIALVATALWLAVSRPNKSRS